MQIQVNGEARPIDANTSITMLLEQLEVAQQTGIAIAINDAVIPRQQWAATILKQEDNILLITATQGG